MYGIDFATMRVTNPDSGLSRPITGRWRDDRQVRIFSWEFFKAANTFERPYPLPHAIADQQPSAQHGMRDAASGCQHTADDNGEDIGSQPRGGSTPNERFSFHGFSPPEAATAQPHPSLNMDNILVKSMKNIKDTIKTAVESMGLSGLQRVAYLREQGVGHAEAFFQPLPMDYLGEKSHNVVAVQLCAGLLAERHARVLKAAENDHFPVHRNKKGTEYLIVDLDYNSFWSERRHVDATMRLQEADIFSAVECITKVTLPNRVLYQEWPLSHLRIDGRVVVAPDLPESSRVWWLSGGSDRQEEIIKFGFDTKGCFMYGPCLHVPGLISDTAKRAPIIVLDFLTYGIAA